MSIKQKIAIVSNTAWSIFNFRLNLAKAIEKEGYKVIIIAPYDKYAEKIRHIFEYYDIFINNKGTNPREDINTIWQFLRLYRKIKPSVILHFTIKPNIYGTLTANMLRIKTINNITGLGSVFVKGGKTARIIKKLYVFSQKRASQIFFQNRDDMLFFKNEGLNMDKCEILPGSGIDLDKFKPVQTTKKDNVFRFLLLGRILWDKGIKEYIEAARVVRRGRPDIEFQLLGPLKAKNPTAVGEKEIREWERKNVIKYLGEAEDVRSFIAQADCIVLPSYREGTPRSLLEAMAMEKPIITTDTVGCREVIEEGMNGFLVPIKDSSALAEAMLKMASLNEAERQLMGKRGREKASKKFDEKFVIGRYLKIIKQTLKT